MIKELQVSLIFDILSFLKENKGLSDKNNDPKLFPTEIETYLASTNEKELLLDIKSVLDNKYSSKLSKAFADFCVNQVPKHLDAFESQNAPLWKGRFGNQLHTFYSSAPEKQILGTIHTFVSKVFKSPFIVVQTPIRLEQDQKASIREELVEKHPHSVPSFSVNKNLIGGLRVFVDGKTHDHSWISQINKLTSITNK